MSTGHMPCGDHKMKHSQHTRAFTFTRNYLEFLRNHHAMANHTTDCNNKLALRVALTLQLSSLDMDQ